MRIFKRVLAAAFIFITILSVLTLAGMMDLPVTDLKHAFKIALIASISYILSFAILIAVAIAFFKCIKILID